jgi:hypothetical protein
MEREKSQEYQEPRWYRRARYVDERLPETDYTELERMSDEEIFGLEMIAARQKKKGLLEAVELEEKRRFLSYIMRWYKKIDRGMPKSRIVKEKYLEEVNEIIRRGFNDYQEDLFCIWPDIQEDADALAAKLPDCPAKQRYKVARNLVGALTYNVAEKVMVKVREEGRNKGRRNGREFKRRKD